MSEPDVCRPSAFTSAKAMLLLLLFAWIAYANCFTKAFLLDDNLWILFNEDLPNWIDNVRSYPTRPLLALSLTLNYKLGGFHSVGYHLFNFAIHAAAGLTLFGIVRGMLLLPRWHGRFDAKATGLAFAIALIWLVHPMNTHAVTYIIQRGESMMGFFYLATVFCVLRAGQGGGATWHGLAIASAWLGVLSKEVMLTGPLVLLLFDRVFLADSWGELVRKRWPLHLGLWSVLAYPLSIHLKSLLFPEGGMSGGMGIPDLPPRDYFFTEPGVLLHYLRLAIWPTDLCFDYRDWPIIRSIQDALPAGIPLILLFLASGFGLLRRHWLGFAGAWFFLILSITSSFVPLLDVVNEYRMYLPLIAVIAPLVLGASALLNRTASIAALALVVVGLTTVTHLRNEDYRTPLAMWADTLEKRPTNYKVYNHIAAALEMDAKWEEAEQMHRTCLKYQTANFFSLYGMGYLSYRAGRRAEALEHLKRAYGLYNTQPEVTSLYAMYLHLEGKSADALKLVDWAKKLAPNKAAPRFYRGVILMDLGRDADAKAEFAEALNKYPDWPDRANKFVLARLRGRFGQSEGINREALFFAKLVNAAAATPKAEYRAAFADALFANRRPVEAKAAMREAIDLAAPEQAEFRKQLEAKLRRFD